MLNWRWATLTEFTANEWHDIGVLRQAVFIVEQRCPYPDLDELDPDCLHLVGYDDQARPAAYLRLVPPGMKFAEASFGRVLVAPAMRGKGLARELILRAQQQHAITYAGQPNRIGAQVYLTDFYQSLGFVAQGDIYLEDEIPHQDMIWDGQITATS
ncbi:GNAT family N-acetyltransferase [Burkholderiaceae bacterium DAT-1]|nr:GNAT family N-acetyltransferase [Burkholderiaceae bacterium DAT-1]